jgi:hypothetical protein
MENKSLFALNQFFCTVWWEKSQETNFSCFSVKKNWMLCLQI